MSAPATVSTTPRPPVLEIAFPREGGAPLTVELSRSGTITLCRGGSSIALPDYSEDGIERLCAALRFLVMERER